MEFVSKSKGKIKVRRRKVGYEYREFAVELPFYYKDWDASEKSLIHYGWIDEHFSMSITIDKKNSRYFFIDKDIDHIEEMAFDHPEYKITKKEFEQVKLKH